MKTWEWIVIAVLVLWFLEQQAEKKVKTVISGATASGTSGIISGIASSAPAIGKFLSGLFGGGSSSSSGPKVSPTAASYTGDSLLAPSFANDTSAAMSDDTTVGIFGLDY